MEDGNTTNRSATFAAIAEALAMAQSEMKNPAKDSRNPHFNSKYADLATVRDAVIPALSKNGLAVLQIQCEHAKLGPALYTLLAHKSGEWFESYASLRPVKTDPQGIGSALTYARRYALQSIAGVAADDDDDGNAGSGQRQQPPARQQAPKPAPRPQAPETAPAKPAAIPAPVPAPASPQAPIASPAPTSKPAPSPDRAEAFVKEAAARIQGNADPLPIDRSADAIPEKGKPDPMFDGPEAAKLAYRKGYSWPEIIKQLNDKFKTMYGITRPWREVSDSHRRHTIDALNKLPDVTPQSRARAMGERLAEVMGCDANAVLATFAKAAGWPDVSDYDALTSRQLDSVLASFNTKLQG